MSQGHAAICNAGHHSDSVPCSCYCHTTETRKVTDLPDDEPVTVVTLFV